MPTQTQTEVGYYTLPVILSFDGVEKNVNSKLGKLFGNVGKNASKSLADNTQADLKRAGDAYTKLRDKAADALGKVRVEEEKLAKARASGKQDQVVAAEERLNKTRRDAKRLNREAAASFEEVTAAQKRLADSASKTSSGLGGLLSKLGSLGGAAKTGGAEAATGFVGGFGGPIAALGTKAGPIGLALAATAGLGLAAGKLLGDQILAGVGQLQEEAGVAAKLGLTAEEIKPLARSAAAAYAANFGDSISGNLDTIRAAVQGGILDPNANQADVEKIVAQLTTVAAVTGEDIPAAVRTAQQAVRTGLAQDVTGAFDLIVKAQQQGLNVSEDLFDTINEYGTQFRKLGLDGPEALGLIAQAVKGGARDTDTAADALKEFSIRAIDGSKLTGQAYHDLGLSFKGTTEAFAAGGDTAKATFQEVVNRIAAVEDPAKRAQIQVALFGTKAEDLGNAVNTMNLSTAVSQFGQVEGAAAQAAETLGGGTAGSIESAKRNIEVAVDGMQKGLAEAFGPALKEVADWVVANQDSIVEFFIGMGHAAITASEVVVNALGDITSGFGQLIEPIGDAYGLFLKFKALLAEDRGDDEEARRLRKESEAAFGWGEGITAAGDAMKAFDASKLHKALDDAAGKAKSATGETESLFVSIDKLNGKEVDIPINVDTDPATEKLMQLKQQFFEAFNVPMPGMPGIGSAAGVPIPRGGGSGDQAWLMQQLIANGLSPDQAKGILAMNTVEGGANNPKSLLGFVEGQTMNGVTANGPAGHLAAFMTQWNDMNRRGPGGSIPGVGPNGQVTDWNAYMAWIRVKIVGQTGVAADWQGNAQPPASEYQARLMQALQGIAPSDPSWGMPGHVVAAPASAPMATGVTPSVNYAAQIAQQFGLNLTSGQRNEPGSLHNTGQAGDFSNGTGNTPQMLQFANYMADNFGSQIAELIYSDPQFGKLIKDGVINNSAYSADILGKHENHVHIAFKPGAFEVSGMPAMPASMAQAMPSATAGMSGIDTSKLYSAGPQALNNAYGPGYEPGIGTPGVNDYGNPGYYRVDPRQLRDAQRAAANAQRAITEADATAQAARDARAALNDTPFVTPTDIAGADKAVRDAEFAASEARLDAANAAEDAALAAKGDFTEAKKSPKDTPKDKKSQGMGLGELGSIASSFLKDTFGIGSFLPGLDNLMPLQMADTLLNYGLSFVPGMNGDPAAGTSNSAFGIPDIAAPPMPQGDAHGGTGGAPGPMNMITIDQSQNFNNSPVGSDPAAVEKARQNNINRAPRLPIGMGG